MRQCRVGLVIAGSAILFGGCDGAGQTDKLTSMAACPLPNVTIGSLWEEPKGYEFNRGLYRQIGTLGRLKSKVHKKAKIKFAARCEGGQCRVCPVEVGGTVGWRENGIKVWAHLEDKPCTLEYVLRHEQQHVQFRTEQNAGTVGRVQASLKQAASEQGRRSFASIKEGKAWWEHQIDELLWQEMQYLLRETGKQDQQIDSPNAYQAFQREVTAKCRAEVDWD